MTFTRRSVLSLLLIGSFALAACSQIYRVGQRCQANKLTHSVLESALRRRVGIVELEVLPDDRAALPGTNGSVAATLR